ncbi:MAG: metal ABC transporter substrate-binding protein [Thalassobaculum sp.]|uniref:metal ABC transporter substrate-binding protein n=1 Tax=Thalassobaculum sp. TaxID=2022740 RepID=UPI0032ECC743
MRGLLAGTLGMLLAATAPQEAEAKLTVVACFPEWAELAREIGGPAVEVFAASAPGSNPDQISVTPELLASLKTADLLVCPGGGYEDDWLNPALDRIGNPKLADGQPGRFFASDFIAPLKDDHHNHAGPPKPHDHMHPTGNPHMQGDPYRMRTLGGQLAKRMIEIDPSAAATYSANARAFVKEIGALAKELEKKAAPLRGINVVTQHENAVYLLNWLKMRSAAVIEPQVGLPPGPGDLARIIELVPTDNVKFVVHAAYEDSKPSQYIAGRTGIPIVNLPFTVGGTAGGGPTFTEFYRDTVERLLDGLAGNDRP